MLYISPSVIPNSSSGNIIVGNSLRFGVGGANIDPIVSLYAAPYEVRIAGSNFNTQFNIDLTLAPTGSTVQASSYII